MPARSLSGSILLRSASGPEESAQAIHRALHGSSGVIEEALVLVIVPPPVHGIGNGGRVPDDDRGPCRRGVRSRCRSGQAVSARAGRSRDRKLFSLFETSDATALSRHRSHQGSSKLGINVSEVFSALQTDLGSFYVNDFNLFGRTFRVTAQAEAMHRLDDEGRAEDPRTQRCGRDGTARIVHARNDTTGPYRVPRYNLYPAAEIDGQPAPGYSQGQAIATMQRIANETLPRGFSFEWTTLAYQQIPAGNTAMLRVRARRWCSCSWCSRPSTKA